jgi:type IV secretion system protein VirD4
VHFICDEFSNVAQPDDFEKVLSVARSRGISISIILQNLSQLKALYEKSWESLVGNCDEFLYLGGNEASTHKYVSELLGKSTIDTNTFGRTSGIRGSYSTNWQIAGRELMTPDEVRMMDNSQALLFVRGERPIQDDKYDLTKHPRIKLTADGGMRPYRHELATRALLSVSVNAHTEHSPDNQTNSTSQPLLGDFELLSEEDLLELYELTDKEYYS